MKSLIQSAANGRMMGNFDVPSSGKKDYDTIPKDIGCARAERRPYYYYGKCIDCPLSRCLEDTESPLGYPSGVCQLEGSGIVKARHALWKTMLKHSTVKETSHYFNITIYAIYAMIRREPDYVHTQMSPSTKRRELILKMKHEEHIHTLEIARRLGVTKCTVFRHLRLAKVIS